MVTLLYTQILIKTIFLSIDNREKDYYFLYPLTDSMPYKSVYRNSNNCLMINILKINIIFLMNNNWILI